MAGRRRPTPDRTLAFEAFERRDLFAADWGWQQNVRWPLDVNNDQRVTPLDALLVVNQLHRSGGTPYNEVAAEAGQRVFPDVNGDRMLSAIDVVQVVNALNRALTQPGAILPPEPSTGAQSVEGQLESAEVEQLLRRAAMATTSQDAIVAVVDRGGRILGIRTEQAVRDSFVGRAEDLAFAIDGAVSKARAAALFSNDQTPLTSRSVRYLSQSTITQREVEANPNRVDRDSPTRGPGFVAPIGVGANAAADYSFGTIFDWFGVEQSNRDSARVAGIDGVKGTSDDQALSYRFHADAGFVPEESKAFLQTFPEAYGAQTGAFPNHQSRGIGTLPGGVPLYKQGQLVGAIGVFFPGADGYASYEQGFVHASARPGGKPQTNADRLNAPRVLEAEFIAVFAASGALPGLDRSAPQLRQFSLPMGRLDFIGGPAETYGPNPTRGESLVGIERLKQVGQSNGAGQGADSGENQPVSADGARSLAGQAVPEGWLVMPHASAVDAIMASDVQSIIERGITEASRSRASLRLPNGQRTKMVLAVTDSTGEVLGLYRMRDATVFSIDAAVAKARNTAYYASADRQAVDAVDHDDNGVADVRSGTAFSSRTIRFLALPRFASSFRESGRPGDFSSLRNAGINSKTAENSDPANPLPASTYMGETASVMMHAAFHPSRNFRDPRDLTRQNGIHYSSGGTPLYSNVAGSEALIGGLGVSGDGADQDDAVVFAAQQSYAPPTAVRADRFFVGNLRLPYLRLPRSFRG